MATATKAKNNKGITSKPKMNQPYQSMHKFHSRISFDSSVVSRIRIIEGVRAFMALIVIFHHVDLINPRINRVSNIIWTVHKRSSQGIRINANDPNAQLYDPEHHKMGLQRPGMNGFGSRADHNKNDYFSNMMINDDKQVIEDVNDDIKIIFGNEDSDRGDAGQSNRGSIRRQLSNKGRPSRAKLTTFGVFAAAFDITLFCLITGYVIAMVGFRCYDHDFRFDLENNTNINPVLCTSNYPFWLYKFIRLIIRRSLKMIYSLAIVQYVTYLLFINQMIKLRGSEQSRARDYYKSFYQKHLNMDSLFWSEINGALWVCETFFWSTFASFIVLSVTINLKYIKYRIAIYILICIIYHDSYYLPIFLGILAADIDHHGYYQIYFTSSKKVHHLLAASVLLIFIRIPYTDIYLSKYLIFKSVCWFNLGLYCLQYPAFWLTRFFSHDYLCYWGQYTFPLYIWHMIVYRFIGTNITPLLVDKGEKITQLLWIDYGLILFGTFCAIIFAIFFNKCIEKPWNNYVVKPILSAFQAAQNEQDKKA